MDLPKLEKAKLKGKKILLRMDLDVKVEGGVVVDDTRIKVSIPTIVYLVDKDIAGIVILGHRGRPGGVEDSTLSLDPVGEHLEKLLVDRLGKEKTEKLDIFMMENLRFNKAEMSPSADSTHSTSSGQEFAKSLAEKGDFFVNDAFGASHREQVSIVGLPRLLPHAAGLHLADEVEKLEKVLQNPKEPVVIVLGGGKEDKAALVNPLLDHADYILVGGLVAKHLSSYCRDDSHMCVVGAHLTSHGADITPDSARNFEEIIKSAGTIVWNGPMGDIDAGYWDGTQVIGKAISESSAYKVVGGGDTIRAIKELGIKDKFDHISTGGGAMLEFLAYGDLPGLRALRE